ncbi:MAG: CPBP family intramembrane metalloprotease [Ignavibacteriaceae bacterium]|nr:CPBP family intramembrane metalloprotease [Ignavibacteriaceae bacterium]
MNTENNNNQEKSDQPPEMNEDKFNSGLPTEKNDLTENETEYLSSSGNRDPLKMITPKMSPVKAGFLGLFGGFILMQVLGSLLTLLILGLDLSKHDMNSVRLLQMASQFLFLLLPALIFSKIIYEKVGIIIRFHLPDWKGLLIFSVGAFALMPLLETLSELQIYFINQAAESNIIFKSLKSMFDSLDKLVTDTYASFLKAESIMEGLIIIAVVAVSPAICEEVLFRGFIQRSFEFKFRVFGSILITSVFFALFHMNPYATLSLILLSVYLGYAVYKTDSIFTGIAIHFVNNFSAVMLYFIFGTQDLVSNGREAVGSLNSILIKLSYFSLLALIPVITIIFYYRNKNRKEG